MHIGCFNDHGHEVVLSPDVIDMSPAVWTPNQEFAVSPVAFWSEVRLTYIDITQGSGRTLSVVDTHSYCVCSRCSTRVVPHLGPSCLLRWNYL